MRIRKKDSAAEMWVKIRQIENKFLDKIVLFVLIVSGLVIISAIFCLIYWINLF